MPIVSAFRRVLILVGFALFVLVAPALLAGTVTSGTSSGGSIAADGFDPNPIDGNVIAMAVQKDGMILIAGTFTELRPKGTATSIVCPRIARLFPDGTVDTSFYININAQVNVMALDNDGKILVGGRFTQVTGWESGNNGLTLVGRTRNHLARIKQVSESGKVFWQVDAGFDPNFGAAPYSDVTSLAVQQDGKILVGGGFTTIQPNGQKDDLGNPKLDPVNHLVRLKTDGTQDTAFKGGTNGYIITILPQEDKSKVLIAGSFTSITNGTTTTAQPYLARLNLTDGSVDSTFSVTLDNAVNVVVAQLDGKLVIGGAFTVVNADSSHAHFARLKDTGALDSDFVGSADGGISSIKLGDDGKIYLTGSFSTLSGSACAYAGRVYASGQIDSSFVPSPNAIVYTMALESNGSLLLGGTFSTLSGYGATSVTRNHLARVTQLGVLDTDLRPDLNGRLRTVKAQKDGNLLVGGSFSSIAGATHHGIVRLLAKDGTVDTSFKAQVEGTVEAILEQADGKLLIGGSFTQVNGEAHAYIARLNPDGSLATDTAAFNVTLSAQVTSIVQQADGKLIIGGAFSSVIPAGATDASTRSALVRLNLDGTLDTTWDPEPNSTVYALLLQSDGKLVAGGAFTSVTPNSASAATTRYAIARFNTDGTIDRNFNPNVAGTILTLAQQSDGSIVFGGTFTQLAPSTTVETRYNIARVTAAGQIDTTFDPHANNVVESIVVLSDDSLMVGGYFTSLNPGYDTAASDSKPKATAVTYVAKLTKGGAVDNSFSLTLDAVAGNGVLAIAPTSKGFVLGGAFASATDSSKTTPVSRLVQVGTNGTVDPNFSDLGGATGAEVTAITTEQNGTLVVAGNFSDIGGTRSSGLAAFYADGTPQTSFSPYIRSGANQGKVYSIGELVNKGTPIATQRSGLARIDLSGHLDTTFAVNDQFVSGSVNALAVDASNKILLGGSLLMSSASKVGLLRLTKDGAIDTSYTDLGLSTIYTIAVQSDGYILVGGSFTYAVTTTDSSGTSTTTNYVNLLRLKPDGTMDTSFKPNPDSTVQEIVLFTDGSDSMLIGGSFTSITPAGTSTSTTTTRHYIAKLAKDGTPDKNFDPKPSSPVSAIQLLKSGKILIGGSFTTLQPNGAGSTTTRNYLALLNADGTLDSTDFGVNGPVYAIAEQPDDYSILLGGSFSTILSTTRNNLARLTSALALDTAFNPNPNGIVGSFAIQSDTQIVFGGAFTAVAPGGTALNDLTKATPRNHIARVTKAGVLDPSFNPNFDGSVGRILLYKDAASKDVALIVVGSFTTIQPNGSLLVGGSFDTINGVGVNNLALFATDGSVSANFLPNPNGEVDAILPLVDDRLIIAGNFTKLDGVKDSANNSTVANYIARFAADNSFDDTFVSKAKGPVYALGRQSGGALIAGGTLAGDPTKGWLARFGDKGALDDAFSEPELPGPVRAIAVAADNSLVVLADSGANSQLLWLTADGTVAKTVAPDGVIKTLSLQADGKLVVGGLFTTIPGGSVTNFARLNKDGSFDPTLTASPNGAVTAMTITTEGKIVIGGTFATVGDLRRFGLARLAPSALTDFPTSTFTVDGNRTQVTWTRTGVLPELAEVAVDTAPDGINYLPQGVATRAGDVWILTGVNLSASGNLFFRTRGVVPGAPRFSNGLVNAIGYTYLTAVPIVTGPTSITGKAKASYSYAITASNYPTSYEVIGQLPGTLTLDSATGVISGTLPAINGKYEIKVRASNSNGTGPIVTIILTVQDSTEDPDTNPRLVNLSILGNCSAGHNVVVGFVVNGDSPLYVYTRAIGPSLTQLGFSADSVVATPRLQLAKLSGVVLRDAQSWLPSDADSQKAVAALLTGDDGLDGQLGATPRLSIGTVPNSTIKYENDSAYVTSLANGPYTITVLDPTGVGGTVLTEVYDASTTPVPKNAPRFKNLSARGYVDSAHFITGGFVISGAAGTKLRVLVRGIGQTLATMGVPGTITDTKLRLFTTGQTLLATNDNWGDQNTGDYLVPNADIAAIAKQVGAFALPAGSKDAAIVVDLPPGIYTAQVTGPSGSTGEAMVEVYEVLTN